jgi:dTDP-4-amino-4,6-dideoxygalactose transaminase
VGLFTFPPVRRVVSYQRTGAARGRTTFCAAFPDYRVELAASGTAALSLALLDARLRHGSARPQAILPAYGCPQLVAACLHASVRPRLVDTVPDGWGYNADGLRAALTRDTVAVLAVNLLGVGDQAEDLLPLVRQQGASLIQDSAQHLPSATEARWHGDYVVLSFGRGKPLNLLRGGALLVHVERGLVAPPLVARSGARNAIMGSRLAGLAFNVATHPLVYGLTSRLPGLGVGTTVYEPCAAATALPESAWGQLGPAYARYSQPRPTSPWTAAALEECSHLGFAPLRSISNAPPPPGPLLRLALKANSTQRRDAVLRELDHQGLGGSNMYATTLDRIQDIPGEVAEQGPFPNAAALADRLLTLPTHSAVTAATVRQVLASMRATSE